MLSPYSQAACKSWYIVECIFSATRLYNSLALARCIHVWDHNGETGSIVFFADWQCAQTPSTSTSHCKCYFSKSKGSKCKLSKRRRKKRWHDARKLLGWCWSLGSYSNYSIRDGSNAVTRARWKTDSFIVFHAALHLTVIITAIDPELKASATILWARMTFN